MRLACLVVSLLLPLVLPGCSLDEDDPDAMADDGTSGGPDSPPVCIEDCDPLDDDCGAGASCLPNGPGFGCMGVATDGVQLGLHEACEVGSQVCDAGLLCLQVMVPGCSGGTGCCVAYCDVTAPQCSTGTACTPFFSEDAMCYPEVGVCVPG